MPAAIEHNHPLLTVNHWIRVAKRKIFTGIDGELFSKVLERYETGVTETLNEIGDDEDMKDLFYQNMPTFQTMKRTLYRHRNKDIPVEPEHQSQIDLSLNFFKLREECIVVGNTVSEQHDKGIVLFSHPELIKNIPHATRLNADATFGITPKLFSQCWILFALLANKIWSPIFYGLMSDKTEESYTR